MWNCRLPEKLFDIRYRCWTAGSAPYAAGSVPACAAPPPQTRARSA